MKEQKKVIIAASTDRLLPKAEKKKRFMQSAGKIRVDAEAVKALREKSK